MNLKILYFSGSAILFLGLLWMFLPHAYHSLLAEKDEISHLTHILQGAIVSTPGLILLVYSNKIKKEKAKTRKRNKKLLLKIN